MKFLDTSFLVDIIKGDKGAKRLLDELDEEGSHVINAVVMYEFLVGAYGAGNPDKELGIRRKLLRKVIVLLLDNAAADEAAKINIP